MIHPDGRAPTFADFVQAVRAYAPTHFVAAVSRFSAERGGWDVTPKRGMRPPWAVAAMVRECIVSSNEHRGGELTERELTKLFNLFSRSHDNWGDDMQSLLTPIVYEQFPYQQSAYEEILRSVALLEDDYDGTQSWPWVEILGSSISEMVTATFLIRAVVMQSEGEFNLRSPAEFEEVAELLGMSDSVARVADGLTRAIPEFRSAALSTGTTGPSHRRFAYNPLLRTPLIATKLGVFAPVPELIYDSVSPAVLYHRGRDAWGSSFTRDLGLRVQQYVGKQLSLGLAHFELVPEIAYGSSQLSADWFVVSDDLIVIVECKASRASLDARLGADALDAQFRRDISKAKGQIERTAQLIKSGHKAFAQFQSNRQIVGLIVTAEPFYLFARAHSDELTAGTPTMLGSLRDLEHLMTLDGSDALDQLKSIASDPEKITWPLGNAVESPPNSVAHNPILEAIWNRMPLAEPVAGRMSRNAIT